MRNGCLRPATIGDTGRRHPKLVRLYRAEWRLRGLSQPPVFYAPRTERFIAGGVGWREDVAWKGRQGPHEGEIP